jgi:hypothetical protein
LPVAVNGSFVAWKGNKAGLCGEGKSALRQYMGKSLAKTALLGL